MVNHIIDFIYTVPNIVLMSFCAGCVYLTKYIIPNNFQKEELGNLGGFLSGVVGSMYVVNRFCINLFTR
nr:hypothetical protein [Rickettsia rhipicephali]